MRVTSSILVSTVRLGGRPGGGQGTSLPERIPVVQPGNESNCDVHVTRERAKGNSGSRCVGLE